jgi:hypothetical protein
MLTDLQVDHLAPSERHTFGELVATWATGIERWAASRLAGPETREDAE